MEATERIHDIDTLSPEEAELHDPEILLPMFHIDSDERAEWLLGKLSDLKAERERISTNAANMIAANMNREKALINRFGDELQQLCEAKRKAPGFKGKTVKFLQGDCNWRALKGGARIVDPELCTSVFQQDNRYDLLRAKMTVTQDPIAIEEAVSVAKLHPNFFSVTLEPVAANVKADIEASGEIPDGVEIFPDSEGFYINGIRFVKPEAAAEQGGE